MGFGGRGNEDLNGALPAPSIEESDEGSGGIEQAGEDDATEVGGWRCGCDPFGLNEEWILEALPSQEFQILLFKCRQVAPAVDFAGEPVGESGEYLGNGEAAFGELVAEGFELTGDGGGPRWVGRGGGPGKQVWKTAELGGGEEGGPRGEDDRGIGGAERLGREEWGGGQDLGIEQALAAVVADLGQFFAKPPGGGAGGDDDEGALEGDGSGIGAGRQEPIGG